MLNILLVNSKESLNEVKLWLVAPYGEAFKVPRSINKLQKHLASTWDLTTVQLFYRNPCYPSQPVEFYISIHFTGGSVTAAILTAAAAEAFRWLRERFAVKKLRRVTKQRTRPRQPISVEKKVRRKK